MKYRFMRRYGSGFRVKKMSEVLGVSRSGYYASLEGGGERARENEKLGALIRQIWVKSRELYGSPRITVELQAQGIRCGKNRVARLMRGAGIRSQTRKAFRVTTKSSGGLKEAEDLVERRFQAGRPNQVWVSDITYIWTRECWLYLAAVLDLFNREVVGWSLERRVSQELVLDALNRALFQHRPKRGLVFHADRGGQYRGRQMRRLLARHGIQLSLGRRGDCYDNAVMESFFSTLKSELVNRTKFKTEQEAQRRIYEYIEVYYNRQRRHSTLNYQTPVEYASVSTHP